MNAPLGELSPARFLAEYWQQKPVLIRQALPGFTPVLDGNDLAGLACEETASARIVSGSFERADWRVSYGPFCEADFFDLPEENWTLLVQDVEKHYPPLQDLMQRFDFLPAWRLDDLMISYAVKGGSVGPHTDQYDVFLLQAEGRRRWQITQSFDAARLDGCPLDVLKSFSPEEEWVLEPGDVLYLPPNVAHFGVMLEPGMTWSIGARAPSAAELLQGLGEWLAQAGGERYADAGLAPAARAGEIDAEALVRFRELVLRTIRGRNDMEQFLGEFMSRFRLAQEPVPPDAPLTPEDVSQRLAQGASICRDPWTRLVWIEQDGR
ncbi:MAG: cupin domain-containing protein, partial [Lysobacterales bacterium]